MGKRLSALHRRRQLTVASGVTLVLCSTQPARAYRPFNGTDAAVANVGELELELGPTQWLRRTNQSYVIAPAAVLNFGVFSATEIVFDLSNFVTLGPLAPDQSRVRLLDTDLLLKRVFREGSLQGGSGPSIAAEGGPLLPEVNGIAQFGAVLNVIISQAWSAGTLHFNEQAGYSRGQNVAFFSSMILEGPHKWMVRPVSELFYERILNEVETWSGLLGVLVTVRDSFVVDAAARAARIQGQEAAEVRLGFSWTLPVWTGRESATSSAFR